MAEINPNMSINRIEREWIKSLIKIYLIVLIKQNLALGCTKKKSIQNIMGERLKEKG